MQDYANETIQKLRQRLVFKTLKNMKVNRMNKRNKLIGIFGHMDNFNLHKIIYVWKGLILTKNLQKINMKLVYKFLRYKNAKLFLKWVK
jgi:DNA integrity scanning protein DisA with diadenylate cyclase activity